MSSGNTGGGGVIKRVEDFLFGLCFGMGFFVAENILKLIASLIGR